MNESHGLTKDFICNYLLNCSYTQELPTRFKKEVMSAASFANPNHGDCIVVAGIQQVLANIGAQGRVSNSEIETIFHELGNANGEIGTQKLMQLL